MRVTMELAEEALPLAEDSVFKVRPRLFLDGNYFVDIFPGSPSAPEIEDGHTFGLDQTAHSVQLDQVLDDAPGDVRSRLPDASRPVRQRVHALRRRRGPAQSCSARRRSLPLTAQVSEAQLGTQPRDLRGMIRGLGKVLGGLGRNEQALRDLVTNFRTVTGSFAAEDARSGARSSCCPASSPRASPPSAS